MLLCFGGRQATFQLQHRLQGFGHRRWHLLGIPGRESRRCDGGRVGKTEAYLQPQSCSSSAGQWSLRPNLPPLAHSVGYCRTGAVGTCLTLQHSPPGAE